MTVIAEIQVAPSPPGTAEDPHAYVEAAIAVIQASGLRYEVGALGTTLEGPADAVWTTVRAAHEAAIGTHESGRDAQHRALARTGRAGERETATGRDVDGELEREGAELRAGLNAQQRRGRPAPARA